MDAHQQPGHHEVVVGVDGTVGGDRALVWAWAEAVRRTAVLRVLTAWPLDLEGGPVRGALGHDPQDAARRVQDSALAAVRGSGGAAADPWDVVQDVVPGPAAEALVAASERADLVVLGTHGRGPVHQYLRGSVSRTVIRHAHCPVVVLPAGGSGAVDDPASGSGAPVRRMLH